MSQAQNLGRFGWEKGFFLRDGAGTSPSRGRKLGKMQLGDEILDNPGFYLHFISVLYPFIPEAQLRKGGIGLFSQRGNRSELFQVG